MDVDLARALCLSISSIFLLYKWPILSRSDKFDPKNNFLGGRMTKECSIGKEKSLSLSFAAPDTLFCHWGLERGELSKILLKY